MLKSHEKELMNSINLFLDNILKINNLFKTLLQNYFDKKLDKVQEVTNQISDLESECDTLRRDIERRIYSETLIPEIRGDVLGMLENLDKIPTNKPLLVHCKVGGRAAYTSALLQKYGYEVVLVADKVEPYLQQRNLI